MGIEFLHRTLRTFSVVLLVFLPFGVYYFGIYPTLSILSGGVWGILNLLLLIRLVQQLVKPGGVESAKPVVLTLVLMVLLFVAGYFLLTIPRFEPWQLLIGFTGLFGILFLKALGRVLVKADSQPSAHSDIQKVI